MLMAFLSPIEPVRCTRPIRWCIVLGRTGSSALGTLPCNTCLLLSSMNSKFSCTVRALGVSAVKPLASYTSSMNVLTSMRSGIKLLSDSVGMTSLSTAQCRDNPSATILSSPAMCSRVKSYSCIWIFHR